ncbi:hypothetical protein [uncultured Shimia sp.]|uniref:hypothetical protein n=1 Tax=uncultured Shimia sp. TaxID=573152 RepID=UPI00261F19D4|nr:hypothetical protein [uncultured Shimia sp.]
MRHFCFVGRDAWTVYRGLEEGLEYNSDMFLTRKFIVARKIAFWGPNGSLDRIYVEVEP